MKPICRLATTFAIVLILILVSCSEPEPVKGPAGQTFDDHLYMTIGGSLFIFDIQDTKDIHQVGRLTPVGSFTGQPQIMGHNLYQFDFDINADRPFYQVFDLNNPIEPQAIKRYPTGRGNSLYFFDRLGYFIDEEHGRLSSLNFSNPIRPQQMSIVDSVGSGNLLVNERFVLSYIFETCPASRYGCLAGLELFEIDALEQIQYLKQIPTEPDFFPTPLGLVDSTFIFQALVDDGSGGVSHLIRMRDLAANDTAPLIAEHAIDGRPFMLNDSLLAVHIVDDEQVVRLRLYDLSDLKQMILLSEISLPAYPLDVILSGDLLLVSHQNYLAEDPALMHGLSIFELSDSANPELLVDLPISFEH